MPSSPPWLNGNQGRWWGAVCLLGDQNFLGWSKGGSFFSGPKVRTRIFPVSKSDQNFLEDPTKSHFTYFEISICWRPVIFHVFNFSSAIRGQKCQKCHHTFNIYRPLVKKGCSLFLKVACMQLPKDYRHTDEHLKTGNYSNRRAQTDTHMDGLRDGQTDTTKYIISQNWLRIDCWVQFFLMKRSHFLMSSLDGCTKFLVVPYLISMTTWTMFIRNSKSVRYTCIGYVQDSIIFLHGLHIHI